MNRTDPDSRFEASQRTRMRVKRPTRYRIVAGRPVSPTWSDRLAGMVITPDTEHTSSLTATRLEGAIQDQAQLLGVLNSLYDMGLPLLSVELLED